MPGSVISKFRPSRDDTPRRPSTPERSSWFLVAVILAAAAIGVVATDLIDPAGRIGVASGTLFGFAADFGLYLALFAAGFAILSTVFDVTRAWRRSTPESERGETRDGNSGDGSFFAFLGFGDGDGGGD